MAASPFIFRLGVAGALPVRSSQQEGRASSLAGTGSVAWAAEAAVAPCSSAPPHHTDTTHIYTHNFIFASWGRCCTGFKNLFYLAVDF